MNMHFAQRAVKQRDNDVWAGISATAALATVTNTTVACAVARGHALRIISARRARSATSIRNITA